MIRNNLLKKAAIVTIVAGMSLTVMGTTAFATEKEEANKEEANKEEANKEEANKEETKNEEVDKKETKNSQDKDTVQTPDQEDEELYNSAPNDIRGDELNINPYDKKNPIWIKEGTYTIKVSGYSTDGGPYFREGKEYDLKDNDILEVREEAAKAFDNFKLDFHGRTVTVTFDVSNAMIFKKEAVIYEVRAFVGSKKNYDPTVDLGAPKKVICDIVEKDKDGNPTKFSYKYNVDDEFFTGKTNFNFKLKEPKYNVDGTIEGGFGIESAKAYEGDKKSKATSTVATTSSDDKSSDKSKDKSNDKKATEQPKATAEVKENKTPKTADASAMNVIYSSILGGFSLMSMGGIYVYRRKKEM